MSEFQAVSTARRFLWAAVVLAGLVGGVFVVVQTARACNPPYDPCPEGQFCCPSCGCCQTEGAEAD